MLARDPDPNAQPQPEASSGPDEGKRHVKRASLLDLSSSPLSRNINYALSQESPTAAAGGDIEQGGRPGPSDEQIPDRDSAGGEPEVSLRALSPRAKAESLSTAAAEDG